MEWIGGTDEAKKLINELIKSGDLINVYSEAYFKKRNDNDFYPKRLSELIKEHGDEFLNHLLVGCFHENHEGMMSLLNLCGVNEEDEDTILSHHNAPSFLFINLLTQEIVIFGLWKRKAQTIEAMIYSSGKASNLEFEDLDYLGVVESIREDFEKIADGIYPTKDGLSEGELDWLYKGKNGNYFRDEDEANTVAEDDEDEGITQEEIDERFEVLQDAEWLREAAEYRLKFYCSKFSIDYLWE